MFRLSFALLLVALCRPSCVYAQYLVNFDDSSSTPYFSIDELSNPNNVWVVAPPQKTGFNAAYSSPNVIITDSVNSYPSNDTSVFYIYHTVNFFDSWWPYLSFKFQIDADSMKDYGTLEASYDLGQSWFNVITDSSTWWWWIPETGQSYGSDSIPFTGTSSQWYEFETRMPPTPSDTIIFRFSFITDSINTNQEGWMIDDIRLEQRIDNIRNYAPSSLKVAAYPNPVSTALHLHLFHSENETFTCYLTDIDGKVILSLAGVRGTEITVPINGISPGMYFWRLSGNRSARTAIGRFIVD